MCGLKRMKKELTFQPRFLSYLSVLPALAAADNDIYKEGGPSATAHGCRPPFFNDRKQAFFDRLRQTDIIFSGEIVRGIGKKL